MKHGAALCVGVHRSICNVGFMLLPYVVYVLCAVAGWLSIPGVQPLAKSNCMQLLCPCYVTSVYLMGMMMSPSPESNINWLKSNITIMFSLKVNLKHKNSWKCIQGFTLIQRALWKILNIFCHFSFIMLFVSQSWFCVFERQMNLV